VIELHTDGGGTQRTRDGHGEPWPLRSWSRRRPLSSTVIR
jgi:hypothetical protein